jgi:hypothetical protein
MPTAEEQAQLRERMALAKCSDFETTMTEILNAFGANPFFLVYDNDGKPWPLRPDQMAVPDILEYVRHRFGEAFVTIAKQHDEFTTH